MPLKDTLKHVGFRGLAWFDRAPLAPLASIRRFLILQHESALGTAIHTTPLIPALRAAVPGAEIVVAGSGFGRDIFRHNPGVDAVMDMPNPLNDRAAATQWLHRVQPLRSGAPYATLTPLGNERTAIALSLWQARATNRVGFTLVPELFTASLVFDPQRSQIRNNLRVVEALGHDHAGDHEPQIFFAAEDLEYARYLLGGSYDAAKPLAVFVTQTSPTQRKSWRAERFVAAAQALVDQRGAQIVFVGTTPERAAMDAICAGVRGTTWNVAGQTNLQQLAALLSLGDVALSLDTGTMHLCRAVGLPTVIIAPAWSPPLEWLPAGNPRYVILKNLDIPRATEDYIIDEVSVAEVTQSLASLLDRYADKRL